ncbi:MAG: hypothetical protein ACK5EX_00210 [Novosphingobium sp.]|jgi:predicted MFS family arabinose efflux permease|uniref:hypothetical protein n=1 Tax=Novosphingobium sp. TaxID=1874826 RepID=UPI00391919AB
MLEGLSFGWRTAVLTVAVVQLAILALALALTPAQPQRQPHAGRAAGGDGHALADRLCRVLR